MILVMRIGSNKLSAYLGIYFLYISTFANLERFIVPREYPRVVFSHLNIAPQKQSRQISHSQGIRVLQYLWSVGKLDCSARDIDQENMATLPGAYIERRFRRMKVL